MFEAFILKAKSYVKFTPDNALISQNKSVWERGHISCWSDIIGQFPEFWQLFLDYRACSSLFLRRVKTRRIFERSTTSLLEGEIKTYEYWSNVALKMINYPQLLGVSR